MKNIWREAMHQISSQLSTRSQPHAKLIRIEDDNGVEDHLSVSNNIVFWNHGSSILHKKLTFEGKVLDACFCSFEGVNNGRKCLCVLLDQNIQIYASNGATFLVSLPCKIKRLWVLNSLLLLERSNIQEQSGPILLSLIHPLEGCKPVAVVVKRGQFVNNSIDGSSFDEQNAEFMENPKITLVHVDRFVIAYNESKKKHFIYEVCIEKVEMPDKQKINVDEFKHCGLNYEDVTPSYDSDASMTSEEENSLESEVFLRRISVKGDKLGLCGARATTVVLVDSNPLSLVFQKENEAFVYDLKLLQSENKWEIIYWGSHKDITSISSVRLKGGILGTIAQPHTALVALSTNVSLFLHARYELSQYNFGVVKDLKNRMGEYVNITTDRTFRTKISVESNSALVNDIFHVLYKVVPMCLFSSLVWDFVNSNKIEDEWCVLEDLFGRLCGVKVSESLQKSAWEYLNVPKRFTSTITLRTKFSQLLPYIPLILLSLHVLYENLKLNILRWDDTSKLYKILYIMAKLIDWTSYMEFYEREWGTLECELQQIVKVNAVSMATPNIILSHRELFLSGAIVPSIYRWLNEVMIFPELEYFPVICGECQESRKICRFYWFISGRSNDPYKEESTAQNDLSCFSSSERVVIAMVEENFKNSDDLRSIPFGVRLPLLEAISLCRTNPPLEIPSYIRRNLLNLLSREDLNNLEKQEEESKLYPMEPKTQEETNFYEFEETEEWLKNKKSLASMLFEDRRLQQVYRMLDTSKPVQVSRETLHMSEDDLDSFDPNNVNGNVEQQTILHRLKLLTLSLPIGRGMLAFSTRMTQATDRLKIVPIVLTARLKRGRGTIVIDFGKVFNPHNPWQQVQIQQGTIPVDNLWPDFHNGVATGLTVHRHHLTRDWILYHRPKKPTYDHAGLLLAIGLQGWLTLAPTDVYSYLQQRHEATTIAMLIGLPASKCGSQDSYITKSLTLHIPSLVLGTDLEMPATVSAAALVGTGLLYQGSAHSFMTEVLLSEMARIPVDDTNQRDVNAREGYSLAAGIGIGLINLARGTRNSSPPGLNDLKIDERLIRYMTGGTRPENDPTLVARKMNSQSTMQSKNGKDKGVTYSARIQESDKLVNVDVTGPGACIALMLMYLKSHNTTIASRIQIPTTKYLLDYVRSDMILLRVMGYNLIMWNTIDATESWIEKQIPEAVQRALRMGEMDDHLRAVYTYLIIGCCMTLGLRYAGSHSDRVTKLIRKYMLMFEQGKIKNVQLSRMICDQAVLLVILAQSCVISGSGDLEMVRIIRRVRKRFMTGIDQEDKSYGHHICLSMALGLTFLGGGRYSLSTSNSSIAYLVTSLYPRFPMSTNDNRYHLQALRHLYALASEPRLLETKDVDTLETCYVPLEIISEGEKSNRRAPCLLPEKVESIRISNNQYYPLELKGQQLSELPSMVLYVKKRFGSLMRSHFSQCSTNDLSKLSGISGDMKSLVNAFNGKEMNDVLFTSIMKDNTDIFYMNRLIMGALSSTINSKEIWNLKILLSYYYYICKDNKERLLDGKFIETVRSKLERIIDERWNNRENTNQFLEYYDIPDKKCLTIILQSLKDLDYNIILAHLVMHMPSTPIRVLQIISKDSQTS